MDSSGPYRGTITTDTMDTGTVTIGYGASTWNPANNIAIGTNAGTGLGGTHSIAIGYGAMGGDTDGWRSGGPFHYVGNTLLGSNTHANGDYNTITGNDSQVISGNYNNITGCENGVTGDYNTISGSKITVFGNRNFVTGHDVLIRGNDIVYIQPVVMKEFKEILKGNFCFDVAELTHSFIW